MQNLSTCLWFDHQAQDAAAFYVSLFPNSAITHTAFYPEGAQRPAGSVLTVKFVLDGCEYLALNGGPYFQFSPAVSIVAYCDTQVQVDRLWDALCVGGQASQCGWLTDKFGVSWQIVPRRLPDLLDSADKAASQRAFAAMMQMIKLDIDVIQAAFDVASNA
jgi:predicted 3-demethylubiquinone-9 3-methyltransferase (glyoxalase superfamily)